MNINRPNLLTLLSGAAGTEGFNSLNAEGTGAGDFAQALMAEIGQLQKLGVQVQGQSPLSFQSLDKLQESALQDIAALLGNKLPIAPKLDQDINLEETLAALKEVLQHIETATASELALMPERNPLSEAGQLFKQDEEGLLQLLAEKQDAPDYAVLLPSVIENVSDSALRQEAGDVQAGVEKRAHDLLQSLVQTGKERATDIKTQAEQTPIDTAVTELSVEAAHKTEMFEQKLSEKLSDWGGDKKILEMAGGIIPLNRQVGIEPKPEIPAMTRPFAHPQWNQELGERILWMNSKAAPFAELNLNPQHLGPVSIRINIDQDQASITFSAQQSSVREAIEAAVPKLREMLGSQQLNLAEVTVSQSSAFDQGKSPGFGQMAQQQQGDGGQKKGDGTGAFDHGGHLADIAEEIKGARALASNGLLSLFA